MAFFILIGNKKTRKMIGVIPAKKGVSLSQLQNSLKTKKQITFTFKIINSAQLKKILLKIKPRRSKQMGRKKMKPKRNFHLRKVKGKRTKIRVRNPRK
jgi:hypothetical protein